MKAVDPTQQIAASEGRILFLVANKATYCGFIGLVEKNELASKYRISIPLFPFPAIPINWPSKIPIHTFRTPVVLVKERTNPSEIP